MLPNPILTGESQLFADWIHILAGVSVFWLRNNLFLVSEIPDLVTTNLEIRFLFLFFTFWQFNIVMEKVSNR